MAEPEKKVDRTAEVAKKIAYEKEELEIRNTLFAARGKPTVPKKAPITNEAYRDDVLRRVNRRESDILRDAKSIDEQGHLITVTMPNKLKVRLTINDDGPVPELITRDHVVRWEAVA